MLLLKNAGGLLPLSRDIGTIAVIGPNAYSGEVLVGNYNGTPAHSITLLDGIRDRVAASSRVLYAEGCTILGRSSRWGDQTTHGFAEAEAAADRADVVILALGLTAEYEGEEGSAQRSEAGGDRTSIDLPAVQQKLLERIVGRGKPVVLVLFSGSALSVGWAHEHVASIVQAWYPGGEGGRAIAEVLFGGCSPAGRLPVTVVRSLDQLPPFEDYSMAGRTYRYMKGEPLYPFGFGLSYTSFRYGGLELSSTRLAAGDDLAVSAVVENVGSQESDDVVQLYLSDLEASTRVPRWSLVGFQRVRAGAGAKVPVRFTVPARRMALIDERGRCLLEPGAYRLFLGGSQPDGRSRALGAAAVVQAEFALEGRTKEIAY